MTQETAESLKFPLLILNKLYIFSSNGSTKKILVARSLYITSIIFILTSVLVQLLTLNGDVFEVIENLEGISTSGHYLGKVSVITYQSKNLLNLMGTVSQFWKTDKCVDSIQLKLDKLLKKNLQLQKLFFVCVGVSIVLCVLNPLFGNDLPFGVWKMENYNLFYKMTLLAQIFTIPPIGVFLVAFDCIFLAFCIEMIVQFRILSECFKRLKVKNVSNTRCPNPGEYDGIEEEQGEDFNTVDQHAKQSAAMKSYIQHHVFLLKFLKTFQEVYSSGILVEYTTVTPIICASMYALFESTDLGLLSRYGLICFTSFLQLALYCIPADYVTSEAVAVGDAIYSSDWYHNPALKKPVSLIIQKSQKPFVFTAGGLFEINSRTLLTVLKVSWSSCTVMNAIKQK